MHALLPPLKGKETHKGRGMHRGLSDCRKTPYGLFRQVFAVCCAHSLFAYGEQLAHLQPEKYFLSGARPDRKFLILFGGLRRQTLRGFFDKLKGRGMHRGLCYLLEEKMKKKQVIKLINFVPLVYPKIIKRKSG